MLDERTGVLLEGLSGICGDGGFKLAEEKELLSCLPQTAGVGREELRRILSYLEERHYIEIKYAEEGLYCLSLLPGGRMYLETVRRERRAGTRRRMELFLFSALGALLGSLLAVLSVLLPFVLGGR